VRTGGAAALRQLLVNRFCMAAALFPGGSRLKPRRLAIKSCNKHNATIAAFGEWVLSNIILRAKAFRYGCAALRDEQSGFPYTAAMEWHKASELFLPNTRAAEYSWRQWERITRLQRQLAGPVGVSQHAVVPLISGSAARPVTAPVIDQNSLADTA
jgi:hypothetical protein